MERSGRLHSLSSSWSRPPSIRSTSLDGGNAQQGSDGSGKLSTYPSSSNQNFPRSRQKHRSTSSASSDAPQTSQQDSAHADFIDVLRAADQYGIPSLSLQHIGISDSDGDDKFARQVHPLGSGLTSQVIQHTTGPEAKDAVPVGTIVALKLFTMQAEKQHQPPKESSRAIFRLILREMEAFCHPMLSSHPNIVQLLFVGWQINNPFPILAMEMGVYGSLDHAIRKPGPGLTTAQKKHVSADIALGLHAIHEAGFVHGDLKPDNVILMPHQAHDRQLIAKIMDFGGSSKKSKGSKSSPAHITRLWCAPEVLNHDPDVDWEKADVYSFGLIFASIWGRVSSGGYGVNRLDRPSSCCLLDFVPSGVSEDQKYRMFWVLKSAPKTDKNGLLHVLSPRLKQTVSADVGLATILRVLELALERYYWGRPRVRDLIPILATILQNSSRDILEEMRSLKSSQGRFLSRESSFDPIVTAGFCFKPPDYHAAILYQYNLAIEYIKASDPYDIQPIDIPEEIQDSRPEEFLNTLLRTTLEMLPVAAESLRGRSSLVRLENFLLEGRLAFHIAASNLLPLGKSYDWETGIQWMITSALHGFKLGMFFGTLMVIGTKYEDKLPVRMFLCQLALMGSDHAKRHLASRWPAHHEMILRILYERFGARHQVSGVAREAFHLGIVKCFLNYDGAAVEIDRSMAQALAIGDAGRVESLLCSDTPIDHLESMLSELPELGKESVARILNLAITKGAILDSTNQAETMEDLPEQFGDLMGTPRFETVSPSPLFRVVFNGYKNLALGILHMHLQKRVLIPDFNRTLILSFARLQYEVGAELLKFQNAKLLPFDPRPPSADEVPLRELLMFTLGFPDIEHLGRRAHLGSEYDDAYQGSIQVLLSYGLAPVAEVWDESPFFLAIMADDLIALKLYIDHLQNQGCDVISLLKDPSKKGRGNSGRTSSVLSICLVQDSFACFEYLLAKFPGLEDEDSCTRLLRLACSRPKDARFVRLLLAHGVKISPESRDISNALGTALYESNIPAADMIASSCNDEELVSLLARDEESGMSVCFEVVRRWCLERQTSIIDSLIWLADHDGLHYYGPEDVFIPGKTPLWAVMLCITRPNDRRIQVRDALALDLLFQHNTIPGRIDHERWNGMTALQTAAVNGHVEVVKLLIQQGADVDVELGDHQGHNHSAVMASFTAYDLVASKKSSFKVPETVLRAGDVEIQKWTADVEEIAEVLRRHGSRSSVMEFVDNLTVEERRSHMELLTKRRDEASQRHPDIEHRVSSGESLLRGEWPKPLPQEVYKPQELLSSNNFQGGQDKSNRESDLDFMTLKYFRDPERQRDARAHERQVLESQDADLATYAAYFDELAVHREEEWRLPPGWEVVAPAGTLGTDSPVFANRHTRSATTVKPPLYKGPGTAAGDGREANQYAYLPDWTRIAPFTDDHNTNEDEDEEEDSGAGHYSGLHYAVMKGDVNLARNLVLLQKEVDMESPSGFTPLQLAVLQNEVEMVKLLLAHGADLSRACPPSPEGVAMLPICVAVAQGCIKMAQVLLDAGADPDAKSDKPSSTAVNSLSALHVCQTTSDNPAMTELLARRGANINIRDNRYKVTPLAAAVGYGREASVRVLLSLGADRTSRDIEGNSVLHLAVMGGHHGILAALLEDWTSDDQAGGLPPCNLSDVNNHGQTAFDLAVQQKDDKSVELLFSRGMKELCM